MRRWLRFVVVAWSALTGIAGAALAAPPFDVAYQGRLLDPAGEPLAGPVDLEIKVFDQAAAGTQLYRELHAGVPLAGGVFSVQLGKGTGAVGSFDAALFAQMNRWLEVAVDGEALAPRQAFSSVAYALQTEHAQTATFAEQAGDAASIGGLDAAALQTRIETLESQNATLREELDVAECRLNAFERRRDICEQPIDPGPCDAVIPRWAFDPVERTCVQFVYGGCGGRENNFETRQECETTCVDRPACP